MAASELHDVAHEQHEGGFQWPIAVADIEAHHGHRAPGWPGVRDQGALAALHERALWAVWLEAAGVRELYPVQREETQPRVDLRPGGDGGRVDGRSNQRCPARPGRGVE